MSQELNLINILISISSGFGVLLSPVVLEKLRMPKLEISINIEGSDDKIYRIRVYNKPKILNRVAKNCKAELELDTPNGKEILRLSTKDESKPKPVDINIGDVADFELLKLSKLYQLSKNRVIIDLSNPESTTNDNYLKILELLKSTNNTPLKGTLRITSENAKKVEKKVIINKGKEEHELDIKIEPSYKGNRFKHLFKGLELYLKLEYIRAILLLIHNG